MKLVAELISELELNQNVILVNDELCYSDGNNFQRWTVTELFDGGFEATDSDGYDDYFFFNELQLGWSISDRTKERNKANLRAEYK